MMRRSLRDEMLRSAPRKKPRRRSRKVVWWVTGLAGVVTVFLLLGALTQEGETSSAQTAEEAQATNEILNQPADSFERAPSETTGLQESVEKIIEDSADLSTTSLLEDILALPESEGRSESDYDRSLFGQAWLDIDRNGCDTRNDILRRDLADIEIKPGTQGCKVTRGQLHDWYSGSTVEFTAGQETSRLVQIDHVVPLSWAWRHGASEWTEINLVNFANDPLNLNATIDSENQSKSDSGPSRWLPTDDRAQCQYIQRFTRVLVKYDLGVGHRDRAMMTGIARMCAESEVFGDVLDPTALQQLEEWPRLHPA